MITECQHPDAHQFIVPAPDAPADTVVACRCAGQEQFAFDLRAIQAERTAMKATARGIA